MHLFGLNIPDLLYSLWHGTIDCDTKNGDSKALWDWVAAARHYLPGSFDRPPRNPADKISSGYKCWEFLNWFYGLAPAMLYGKLPGRYWANYCKLVAGARIVFQWESTLCQREHAHLLLCTFVDEYERIYVQQKIARMHFVPQCIHAVRHTPSETLRIGSLICTSQFTMEHIIGDLGGEIRQPSNPYANLSERALRRARVNALTAMLLDLEGNATLSKVPRVDLGDGFSLLHPREDRPRQGLVGMVRAREVWVEMMCSRVQRWARCRLPNSQVCRSAWKEVHNGMTRISRNVKYAIPSSAARERSFGYAEVQYYFRCKIGSVIYTLAIVSRYSAPNEDLLQESSGAVWACCMSETERERLAVIDIKSILSCVAMIPCASLPHPHATNGQTVYFVMEKLSVDHGPGLDSHVPETDENGHELE
ncbi:hypothetical protein LXA43DRAFT_976981 [Ganoderma leucocontextum]|nr:hypothetical protein LXA43DRAFT_976981 [Ganoderma leucocontextum]